MVGLGLVRDGKAIAAQRAARGPDRARDHLDVRAEYALALLGTQAHLGALLAVGTCH